MKSNSQTAWGSFSTTVLADSERSAASAFLFGFIYLLFLKGVFITSAAHRQGFISYSIKKKERKERKKNRITLVAFCNKQLCKNFFSRGFGKKNKQKKKRKKMRWCVVLFFSRSCFIQTENNINHMTTNKTNIWLEGDGRSRAVAPCVPPQRCFECQSSRDSASAFVRTSPRFSDPFPLTLRSSWKRRRLWRSTEGARWTLCRFGLCMFQLAVHLAKQQRKKK